MTPGPDTITDARARHPAGAVLLFRRGAQYVLCGEDVAVVEALGVARLGRLRGTDAAVLHAMELEPVLRALLLADHKVAIIDSEKGD